MFTNDQLQAMIRGEIIGDIYPYSSRDAEEITNYLKQIKAELARNKMHLIEEEKHFGSGYASYRQWFCYLDEHIEFEDKKFTRDERIESLGILISSLAPVIVIAESSSFRTLHKETNTYRNNGGTLISEPSQLIVTSKFLPLYNKLERIFMKYHFTVLKKEDLDELLPFDVTIPTIFRKRGQYLTWDAVFYWED